MSRFVKFFYCLVLITAAVIPAKTFANNSIQIPILVYHNFNPTIPGSMTLTPARLESQLKWLKDNGFNVIPLQQAVEYLQGKRASLPSKPVVITADDGWQSQYTYLYPLAKKYNMPMTLFIYPGTISKGKNAMTWDELKELQKTGLFDIQSHTYSHPNFKQIKRKFSEAKYEKFVSTELVKSKQILEEQLGVKISYLAWPFGIYNDYLEQQAKNAGYVMAFTIDAIPANKDHRSMAQPRYMIVVGLTTKTFENIANQASKH